MALTEYFIRFLQRRDVLQPEDLERLKSIPTTIRRYESGEEVVPAGNRHRSCMMLRGMTGRVHSLPGRCATKAITALHVPGDFVDLHSFVLKGLTHVVVAFGRAEVEFVDHKDLRAITEDFPHLTRMLWMATAIDAAIHRQWLVASASLRASPHLAHLLCELYTRMSLVGAARDGNMSLPLLQRELADTLGYSPIHINRAVRDLRDRKLVRWQGTEIEILNWDGLVQLARLDPTYLEIERQRR